MLEDIWNGILDLTAKLVIPDWGSTIALLPIVLLVVIVVWLILLVRRFATAGPTRRGKRRITPVAPAGVHMPGGSFAPILVAFGAAALFWGIIVGGPALLVGIVALVLALLVWGAEELRAYDRTGDPVTPRLAPPIHAGPPPGVHMPGPSFRPFLAALGVTVLFLGLVFGGWLLLVGVILLIATLLGWLVDARKEYVNTVEADTTGHLENIPAPNWPRRLLWVGGLLVAVALLVDNGILPPRSETAAGGEPGTPAASAGAGGGAQEPAPSGPGPATVEGDVVIVAENVQFTTADVNVKGPDFTIGFDNRDQGLPHDVDIAGGDGSKIFDGDVVKGPATHQYEVSGLKPGSYDFMCSVHPNMKGKITVE